MIRAAIGLGANLGDAAGSVRAAMDALAGLPATTLQAASRFYRTPAWGVTAQPDFINAVALVETTLSPRDLLDALLAIERSFGRTRLDGERWGPRTLDLDILLFGNRLLSEERLTVPHYHMHARAFVLYPLAEIAPPDLQLPDGRSLEQLLAACPFEGLERLVTP